MWTPTLLVLLAASAAPAIVASQGPESTAPAYQYKGHQVSAAWIDQQYAYFQEKIAYVDGKYYDIGKSRLRAGVDYVREIPPKVGEARLSAPEPTSADPRRIPTGATVLQVIGKDAAIITNRGLTFHVRGINPEKQIDGTPFQEILLIYVGTYKYINAMGTRSTIQSFVVYQPLTREQFVEALAGGLDLVRYKQVTKKVAKIQGGSAGDGFSIVPGQRVMVDETKIVEQPVLPPPGSPLVKAETGKTP
jgi:hypothetical protein